MPAPDNRPSEFKVAAQAAFPASVRFAAGLVAADLTPFVDRKYGVDSFALVVDGQPVSIPTRIHFRSAFVLRPSLPDQARQIADCLLSRSLDGYSRQSALQRIVGLNEAWSVPYVVMLLGEYVVEIIEEIRQALPNIDLALVRELLDANPRFHSLLNARSVSYWNCFYRARFPDYATYPAAVVLRAVETLEQPRS